MLERLKLLLKTSRPLLWCIPMFLFLVGLTYSGGSVDYRAFIFLFILSFPYNLFVYGVNDVYDYASDRLNPRKGTAEGVVLSPHHQRLVLKASTFSSVLLLALSYLFGGMAHFFVMAVMLLSAYFYSASPVRLKAHPPLDSLTNVLIYAIPPFLLGWMLWKPFFALPFTIYSLGLSVAGYHAYSTVMDYTPDKKAGDRTCAVVFGKRGAAFLAFVIMGISFIFSHVKFVGMRILFVESLLALGSSVICPSEKLAYVLTRLLFVSFIIAALWYIFL